MTARWYYPLRWSVLILLGLAIYAQTFGYGFVFDDLTFIVNNPCIRRFDYIHYIWKTAPYTRTLGFYSFALNYWINGLNPAGYHIFNFAVHLLAVGLVWALAAKLFKAAGETPAELPFVIALFFLVHPCQTQAVTYVSQRFESMAFLFYLGSIYCYLCGRMASSMSNKIISFACCLGFAVAGILTKEVAATIPLMVLALEFILLDPKPLKPLSGKIYLAIIAIGILFVLVFMNLVKTDLIRTYFQFHAPSESHDGDMITGGKYVMTQMRVFLTFLRLLVLPINQNADYDYPLSTGLFGPPLTFVGLCLIGFMVFLIFKLRSRRPLMAFGPAWMLAAFSINTAPRTHVIWEHKLYLISFGFFVAAVYALSALIKDRKIMYGILIALIAVLAVMSYQRNQIWKNELTLWDDVARKSPHKARAYNNRGLANYYQNHMPEALRDFNKALVLKPDNFTAYINRGFLFYNQGNFTQALADDNKAIAINPQEAQAYNNRGLVYYSEGNWAQSVIDYNHAVKINPGYGDAYYNRGIADSLQGHLNQALSDYSKAIESSPGHSPAYYNRGLLWAQLGDDHPAILDFSQAINIDPGNAEVYLNRGMAFARQSDYVDAISDYNKALKINPGNAQAFNNRGLAYLLQGNPSLALADYTQAVRLNPHYAQAYLNLASFYYQSKQYAQAWENAHKAQLLGVPVDAKFINAFKQAPE